MSIKRHKTFSLHEKVRAELRDSVSFYREQGGEMLADRFKGQVTLCFRTIRENPELYPHTLEITEVQKCRLPGFPFSILYMNLKEEIVVVTIAHGSRKPGFWTDRMKR